MSAAGRRAAALVGGLLLSLAAPAAGQAVAWNARLPEYTRPLSPAEPILVELHLGRISSRTVEAYRQDKNLLLPFRAVLELGEVGADEQPDSTVTFTLQPGNIRGSLTHGKEVLEAGRASFPLAPSTHLRIGGEDYISSDLLAQLFKTEFRVDLSELDVTIMSPEVFPLGQRVARESARRGFRGQSDENPEPDVLMGLDRRSTGGAVVDYTLVLPTEDPGSAGSWNLGVGADFFGGSFETTLQNQGLGSGTVEAFGSWTGVWRDNARLSQARLGDGLSTGPRPRSLQGFSISNSPYVRPSIVGNVPLQLQLGAGWQVEAYRGGRLVSFDSVNSAGQYSLDMPIQYGENPVDLVAYGPNGEVRRLSRTYRVLSDALPYRRFEYGLSAGACRVEDCDASANMDLRYGLTRRIAIRGGVDQFWRSGQSNLFHPYAGFTGNPINAIVIDAEAVANAELRGNIQFEPTTAFRLSTEYATFDRGVSDPIFTLPGRFNQWNALAFVRPLKDSWAVTVDGGMDGYTDVQGETMNSRVSVSWQTGLVRLVPGFRALNKSPYTLAGQATSFWSLGVFTLPNPRLGPFMGGVSAQAGYEVTNQGNSNTAFLSLTRLVTKGLRAEISANWFRDLGTTFGVTISTELPTVRSVTSAFVPSKGPAYGNQFLQGSALLNAGQGRVGFAAGPSLQRAGVMGIVYLDANGDGKRQADETVIPGVRVQVGYQSATTDSLGRYRVWDLQAFEPVAVMVDSSSLVSPLWVPTTNLVMVEPQPNRFRSVDIAVTPAGVVDGKVTRQSPTGTVGVAGVTVVLVDLHRGTRRSVMTFSDGTFYSMGVKPGDYEIRLDDRSAARLGMTADPVPVTVKIDPNGDTQSGIELQLH
ncbi:MAG TPA: hypothetical protein VJN95_05415 [Gemmatimonadales bacterium]|nr:hypothetical protein [Gemmatimonadales bacterium]